MLVSRNIPVNIKDFAPKDVHSFITFGSRMIYKDEVTSTVGRGNIFGVKHGKYDEAYINKLLNKGVTINFPFNNRDYISSDYVEVYKSGKKYYKTFDIKATVGKDGTITFFDKFYYYPLTHILPKYRKPDATWNFKFLRYENEDREEYIIPVITFPTKKEEWEDILKAFLEFMVFVKVLYGSWFKIILTKEKEGEEKTFSEITPDTDFKNTLLSFAPTVFGTVYRFVFYPKIMQDIAQRLNDEVCKSSGSGEISLRNRLLGYCTKTYKDVYFANIGSGSCFLDTEGIRKMTPEAVDTIMKEGDSKRLRTEIDWCKKALEDKKYLVMYNDNDSSVAIAHEVGHYLIAKDPKLKNVQLRDKAGIFSEGFISFASYVLGGISGFLSLKAGVIGEIISGLVAFGLRSPILFTEFLASYKGYQLLEEKIGCSEEELKNAKKFYRLAWLSYLGKTTRFMSEASVGRLIGKGISLKLNS